MVYNLSVNTDFMLLFYPFYDGKLPKMPDLLLYQALIDYISPLVATQVNPILDKKVTTLQACFGGKMLIIYPIFVN